MEESVKILDQLGIRYDYYEHEPILNYETAKKVDEQYHLTGQESKNLFMKTKSGKFYVLVTIEGVRMDSKFMKSILGEKVYVASPNELLEQTGYVAGCAASFPYRKDIGYLVDNQIFLFEKLICSAGVPTASFEIRSEDLKKVYATVENDVRYIDLPNGQE